MMMTSAFASSLIDLFPQLLLSDGEDKDAKARRVVRANNFTQQTNALDVDKHMCVNSIPLKIGHALSAFCFA
jgi:hypothetical protein